MLRTALRQSIRSYASKAAASSSTAAKPPVQLFGLDGSYASALYTASAKASSIEQTEKSLASLNQLIQKDDKLSSILANPALSADDKKQAVDIVSKQVSLDKTVTNFLEVLAENNRLNLISGISQQFEVLTNAYHGIVEATVTSAEELDKKTLNRLEAALQKSEYVGSGKTLKLENKINSDILGGLIVEVGDNTVDLSVSTKINKLNKMLTDNI